PVNLLMHPDRAQRDVDAVLAAGAAPNLAGGLLAAAHAFPRPQRPRACRGLAAAGRGRWGRWWRGGRRSRWGGPWRRGGGALAGWGLPRGARWLGGGAPGGG